MSSILVEAKVVGQRRTAPFWTIPDSGDQFGDSLTLRDLIRRVVQHEVAAFRDRQAERRLLRVLSPGEIRLGVEAGKIDSGGHDVEPEVDPETAVGVALQGFVDGLYYVFIDGEQQRDLDGHVLLGAEARLTFLRLTPLAGG